VWAINKSRGFFEKKNVLKRKSFFFGGMFIVQQRNKHWIIKNGTRFQKTYTVLLEIRFCLVWIPFKIGFMLAPASIILALSIDSRFSLLQKSVAISPCH
jgi:hypothetical protein